MNPEVDIYLKYVELMRAKKFLNGDWSSNLKENTRLKLHDQLDIEISNAEHLLENPWLVKVSE